MVCGIKVEHNYIKASFATGILFYFFNKRVKCVNPNCKLSFCLLCSLRFWRVSLVRETTTVSFMLKERFDGMWARYQLFLWVWGLFFDFFLPSTLSLLLRKYRKKGEKLIFEWAKTVSIYFSSWHPVCYWENIWKGRKTEFEYKISFFFKKKKTIFIEMITIYYLFRYNRRNIAFKLITSSFSLKPEWKLLATLPGLITGIWSLHHFLSSWFCTNRNKFMDEMKQMKFSAFLAGSLNVIII